MLLDWRNGARRIGGCKVNCSSISKTDTLFGGVLMLLKTRRQRTSFLRGFHRRAGLILRFGLQIHRRSATSVCDNLLFVGKNEQSHIERSNWDCLSSKIFIFTN